ncbi:MAG TPA: ArsI/CadI family heavy metal resistance metalloenzyme [Acidimicrobiia bacterium]
MSRVQLALNVGDLDAAIEFYSKLFGTAPAKVRDGYANFVVAEPPLKLVLIVGGGEPGTLNHVGVEVLTSDDVAAAIERFQVAGLAIDVEEHTTCCYAVQDKVWVQGPDDRPWEIYTVLDDADVMDPVDSVCCASAATVDG